MLGYSGVFGRMKKIIVSLLLAFSLFSVFGATIDPFKMQTISGFIDDISYLYVGPFRYESIGAIGYAGINLDYNDSSNTDRHLIKPSTTSLSTPGVQIGSFSALATYTQSSSIQGVKLTITHAKLSHTTEANATLEYELAVVYRMGNGTTTGNETTQFCLSTESASNNKIEIILAQSTKIASIQNGYLYFRLAKNQTPTVTGQYSSVVTFMMEAI